MSKREDSKRRIWVNKCSSFEEAEKSDLEYYMNMSHGEKLDTLQMLRESYYAFSSNEKGKNENRKRLRRSFKVIQQT